MAKKSREKKRKARRAEKVEKEVAEVKAPEKKESVSTPKTPGNQNMILTVVVILIVAALSWAAGSMMPAGSSSSPDLGSEDVGTKVIDFLQSRLGVSYPGIEVELAGVEDYPNMTDTYEVNVKITYQDQTQELPYYASKDGRNLFTIIGDLEEEIETPETPEQPAETGDVCSQLGVTKNDKPDVEVFIMSYCPYGLQMQKAVLPVMELLGDKADISIKWVSYIMHGEKEIDENNVQECIQREYPDKYIDYSTCFTLSDDTEGCMSDSGIDKATVDTCIEALDAEFKISELYANQSTWSGGRYPQYPVHAPENSQYGVRGSPTTVINGKVVSVSRSPEAVKQAVCCAFNTPPAECDTVLSSAAASPGIGGGTGADTTASC